MGLPNQTNLVSVTGPNDATQPGGEATLDIEFIMGVAGNTPTTFWSLGELHDGQEPFLDWITDVLNTNIGLNLTISL
jgi:tripeptidyl-peptidase-1